MRRPEEIARALGGVGFVRLTANRTDPFAVAAEVHTMRTEPAMPIATITVQRPDEDITCEVEVEYGGRLEDERGPVLTIREAIDEMGRPVVLTAEETAFVLARAREGHDETGR